MKLFMKIKINRLKIYYASTYNEKIIVILDSEQRIKECILFK